MLRNPVKGAGFGFFVINGIPGYAGRFLLLTVQHSLQREAAARGGGMRFWKGSCSLLALLWVSCGAAWAEAAPEPENNCGAENGKHLLWENDVLTGKLLGRS